MLELEGKKSNPIWNRKEKNIVKNPLSKEKIININTLLKVLHICHLQHLLLMARRFQSFLSCFDQYGILYAQLVIFCSKHVYAIWCKLGSLRDYLATHHTWQTSNKPGPYTVVIWNIFRMILSIVYFFPALSIKVLALNRSSDISIHIYFLFIFHFSTHSICLNS